MGKTENASATKVTGKTFKFHMFERVWFWSLGFAGTNCIHAPQIQPSRRDGRSWMIPLPRWHSSLDAQSQSASLRPHSVWWWWPPWTPGICWWSSVEEGLLASQTTTMLPPQYPPHQYCALLCLLGHLVLPLAGGVVQVGVAPVVVDSLLGLLVHPVELIGAVLHVVPQAQQVALTSCGIGLNRRKLKGIILFFYTL